MGLIADLSGGSVAADTAVFTRIRLPDQHPPDAPVGYNARSRWT